MTAVDLPALLEAGVHFGHQTRRWNPKMKKFIFTAKNGIYLIDLEKTLLCLDRACAKVREVVTNGGSLLYVGTKRQAAELMKQEALRAGMYYVTERWLGGMLTNFQTIRQSIKRLKDLERMRGDGTFEKLPKKEVLGLEKEITQLEKVLGGVKEMGRLPYLVYVIDTKKEKIAVAEANKLGIPVIAIVDTNSDPDVIDFPIPGNDDSFKAIEMITRQITDTAAEIRTAREKEKEAARQREEKAARAVAS